MGDSLNSILDQSSSVLIMLPTKPYFDQVAAGLSLYLALRDKKEVQIVSSAPMTVEFNRLIGVNKISQELGNKNLVIKFTDYKANDIERVSYDIEDGEFRLTVIPKEKLLPPSKDNIEVTYMGVSADAVILIGGANDTHFPMLSSKDLIGTKLIHIGIRDLTLSQKEVISLARPASSISEVVGMLLKESSMGFDEDVATNLVMGLEDATNNLTDQNITADTFALIADLMRAGGRRNARAGVKRSDFPAGAIPGAAPRTQVPAWQQQQGYPQQTPQQPIGQTQQQARQQPGGQDEMEAEEQSSSAPQDWLEPKIFKGTSVK